MSFKKSIRALAINLPQFHPIPENDKWWSPGFTEWTNVTKATPRFEHHYQPHLPRELGFYDLRLSESREAQSTLAQQHGIYGFCYYHYWFSGKRLLEKPVDAIIDSNSPQFPFCLCWANENWTRRWDGQDEEVLMSQSYSELDDEQHIKHLLRYFRDPRYIKVDGKPVFILYRIQNLPFPKQTFSTWTRIAMCEGFPGLYIICFNSMGIKNNPIEFGIDASADFHPTAFPIPRILPNYLVRAFCKYGHLRNPLLNDRVYRYKDYINFYSQEPSLQWKNYPCVMPSWDNSARRKKDATILHDSTPELYEKWLSGTCASFEPYSDQENFIFINAWNEWAEGNHLEPCQKWGMKYLDATKRILSQYS